MLEELKHRVYEANMLLPQYGLVTFTWGNASELDQKRGIFAIKPSGVDYSSMCPEQMVVSDLSGTVVEGELRPSSDLLTHLELYRSFAGVGAVVHTHSPYATARAQAELDLPCYGTTHADSFYGAIPCTRHLTKQEVDQAYEANTGLVIAETFRHRKLDPMAIPGVLVCKHGPFSWGANCKKAVENALILEETARMALITTQFSPQAEPAPQYLLDKHYFRKHGANAYYGQN